MVTQTIKRAHDTDQRSTGSGLRVLRHATSTVPQLDFWRSPARFRLFVGGVGSGKTRAGCVEALRMPPGSRGMILAPTYPMLRDTTLYTFMQLADAGGILKAFYKSDMVAELIDGKEILFRTAENPDRLRGPNLGWFYLDEASLMKEDVFMIMLGRLRLDPGRGWLTTTPKGKNWVHKAFEVDGSVGEYDVIRSSSRSNPFLPAHFLKTLERTYSRRMIRQEIDGEFIDDVEGALWTQSLIDATRILPGRALPTFQRVVTAVDPAVTSNDTSDETGIVAVGIGMCDCKNDGDDKKPKELHGFVLGDASLRGTPTEWARAAVGTYFGTQSDRLIGEQNNGGELVEQVIRTVDPRVSYKAVHAARGKITRAEPISALYEKGLVHHVGIFAKLEDEMTSFVPGNASPSRMDALVWALTELLIKPIVKGGTL